MDFDTSIFDCLHSADALLDDALFSKFDASMSPSFFDGLNQFNEFSGLSSSDPFDQNSSSTALVSQGHLELKLPPVESILGDIDFDNFPSFNEDNIIDIPPLNSIPCFYNPHFYGGTRYDFTSNNSCTVTNESNGSNCPSPMVDEESRVIRTSNGQSKLSSIKFDDISKYFYMPITEAAKEMKVGLTLLKKRCRELGISRWPHRKMKSLKFLIHNVQELGKGGIDESIRRELERLEESRRLMEKMPELQLTERTKKLRQACFKANYKMRRAMQTPLFGRSEDQKLFIV